MLKLLPLNSQKDTAYYAEWLERGCVSLIHAGNEFGSSRKSKADMENKMHMEAQKI